MEEKKESRAINARGMTGFCFADAVFFALHVSLAFQLCCCIVSTCFGFLCLSFIPNPRLWISTIPDTWRWWWKPKKCVCEERRKAKRRKSAFLCLVMCPIKCGILFPPRAPSLTQIESSREKLIYRARINRNKWKIDTRRENIKMLNCRMKKMLLTQRLKISLENMKE